jgi:hypothetical protein
LLQGIPNNDEWKLFEQLIHSQHLKLGASGSTNSPEEDGLERNPARLVTMMLDEEANILKDRGDDKNMVLYSGAGGKKAKKGTSARVATSEKDIECYGCHKKGHKRSECPDKKKKGKENSGKPAVTTSAAPASVTSESNLNKLWMATDLSTCAGIVDHTADDWYIGSACTQHVTRTKAYFVNYRDDRRMMSAFNGTEVVAEGLEDVQLI